MKAILVRIGVDHAYGGWNAPADPISQRFVYVPIPERTGTKFHPGCDRPYSEWAPVLESFSEGLGLDLYRDLKCPSVLLKQWMHLDPDFDHLTYGDVGNRRGSDIRELQEDDLLVFYAGLRPTSACEHKLIYALVGIYVVDEVVCAADVPAGRRAENAHTRKAKVSASDIIVRGKPGVSGLLRRYIPIGEFRDRAYRVSHDVLNAWGGLSVKDGYIQRSARPPKFLDAPRFYDWFRSQGVSLVAKNYQAEATEEQSRVVVVHLRQPKKSDPKEMRSDPFWEFGSFGCTGCHGHNLMNPRRIGELAGARLAFAQGGAGGFKLVMLTPPVEVVRHSDRCELRWRPMNMPFRYATAPLIVDRSGRSDLPRLKRLIRVADRSTWPARFSSKFRSRRIPLPTEVAREVCEVFDARHQAALERDIAVSYDQALPYPPSKIDPDRTGTYNSLLANASGDIFNDIPCYDPKAHPIEYVERDWQKWLWLRPNESLVSYDDRSQYALTIDGYRYAEVKWHEYADRGESGRRVDAVLAGQMDGYGFADLRAILFLIQRAIKWTEGSEGCELAVHRLLRSFDMVYEHLCKVWDDDLSDHVDEVLTCCDQLGKLKTTRGRIRRVKRSRRCGG
jgi:Nucleotide modification associated domain 3